MNTMSKLKLITLVLSACIFFPAYAQTDAQSNADLEQHLKKLEGIQGKPASRDVKEWAPVAQFLVRERIRSENEKSGRTISVEELNKETNAVINKELDNYAKSQAGRSSGKR